MFEAFHGFPLEALWIIGVFFAIIIALVVAIGYALFKRVRNRWPELFNKSKREW